MTYNMLSKSIFISWLIMLILFLCSWILRRKLKESLSIYQVIAEGIYLAMYNAIKEILPDHVELVFPFVATLWIFITLANLIGVIPGLSSPTADLSITTSLAVLTFFSVHWFGIRAEGLTSYLRHYIKPSPFLLPFHLMSEFSRIIALAIRLFGNMMSLELTALIILMVAGFLAPIPILMLHLLEAIIQAYIFGMLALIYIAGGIQSQIERKEKELLHG